MGREEFDKFLQVHSEKGWKIHIYPQNGEGVMRKTRKREGRRRGGRRKRRMEREGREEQSKTLFASEMLLF